MVKKTKVFIEKARKVHGNKFDYSKVEYVNNKTKVTITCPVHGEFEQTPNNHLSGSGCKECYNKARTKTTEEWIKEAREVHGDRYIYDKAKYTRSGDKVTIICPVHGEFKQIASDHLSGSGCRKCYGNYSPTTEEWIERAKEVHGNLYDYSKVKYKGNKAKVKILCNIHGEFEQEASSHLSGAGCNKCYGNYSPTTEGWVSKARKVHGNKFDYSKVEYIGVRDKVNIICPVHGDFEQMPKDHLNGSGCRECYDKTQTKTTEEWIEMAKEVHGSLYDYSKVEYIRSSEKVTIICKEHGEFEQIANSHLSGNGCRECYDKARTKTTETFIKEAKEVHGSLYDYSKVEYIRSSEKVTIICKKHGEFEQEASSHLSGAGCKECALGNMGWSNVAWTLQSEKSQDFDSFKVYIIRCWNEEEEFIKIGKTFRTVEQRFGNSKYMPYNYEVIKIIEKETAEEATSKETELHYKFRNKKYIPEIDFGGMFECFTKNILKTIKI